MTRFYRWSVPAIIASVLLTPPLTAFMTDAIAFRIETALVLVWLLLLWASRDTRSVAIAWGKPQRLLLLFVVVALGSTLTGLLFGQAASIRDVVHVGRYVLFVGLLTLVASAIKSDASTVDRVYRWLAICSIGVAVIVVQQYWDIFGLNARYLPQVAPTQFERLVYDPASSGGRPVAMTGNPNELGFMSAILALTFVHVALSRSRRTYLMLFLVQLILLFLSSSRAAAVALAAGLLVYGAINAWRFLHGTETRLLVGVGLMVLIFGSASYLVVSASDQTTNESVQRFSELSNIRNSQNWAARARNWEANKALFLTNPIVGVGPLSYEAPGGVSPDNEWLLLLRSYGIVGTALLAASFISLVGLRDHRADRLLGIVILVACSVYMLPASVIYSTELMPLTIIILTTTASPGAFRGRSEARQPALQLAC
jgi:hypothetical protein